MLNLPHNRTTRIIMIGITIFFITTLSGENFSFARKVRKGGIKTVSNNGARIESLMEDLQNENSSVRMKAAYELGETENSRVVQPLIKTLVKEKDWRVRANISAALGKIGGPAVKPLIETLLQGKYERDKVFIAGVDKDIAYAFADIGGPAVKPLIEVFRKGDKRACGVVAHALEMIGEPAVEALKQALQDKQSLQDIDASEWKAWVLDRILDKK